MKTIVKVQDTRQPGLTRAVIRQTGRENLEDIVRHGCDCGFAGFTYYSDTVKFFRAHRREIQERLEQDASEFGTTALEMIQGFNCLKCDKLTLDEIGAALYGNRGEAVENIQNALAWYAAEEIAREMNPDL